MDDLLTNLKASSKRWATAITNDANKNLGKYSTLIKVKSQTIQEGDKLRIVTTGINVAEDPKYGIKNVARAYEYGSGIHSRNSKYKHKYLIAPRTGKFLAFKWDIATKNPMESKFLEDGRVLLASVNHPGVQAANSGKGYIKPAIDKVRTQIRKEIPSDIRKAVLGNFRKSFKDAK